MFGTELGTVIFQYLLFSSCLYSITVNRIIPEHVIVSEDAIVNSLPNVISEKNVDSRTTSIFNRLPISLMKNQLNVLFSHKSTEPMEQNVPEILLKSNITLYNGKLAPNELANRIKRKIVGTIGLDGIIIQKTWLGFHPVNIAISTVKLGMGVFSTTYAAQNLDTGEWLAYKVISQADLKKFASQAGRRNAKLIPTVDDEIFNLKFLNMLRTNRHVFPNGDIGFGMVFMDGINAEEELENAQSEDQVWRIVSKSIISLLELHKKGLAHNDAHPRNIVNGQLVDMASLTPGDKISFYHDLVTFFSNVKIILGSKFPAVTEAIDDEIKFLTRQTFPGWRRLNKDLF